MTSITVAAGHSHTPIPHTHTHTHAEERWKDTTQRISLCLQIWLNKDMRPGLNWIWQKNVPVLLTCEEEDTDREPDLDCFKQAWLIKSFMKLFSFLEHPPQPLHTGSSFITHCDTVCSCTCNRQKANKRTVIIYTVCSVWTAGGQKGCVLQTTGK